MYEQRFWKYLKDTKKQMSRYSKNESNIKIYKTQLKNKKIDVALLADPLDILLNILAFRNKCSLNK